MRDPIHDDAVRDELDSLGMKHFLDVRATIRRLLEHMPKQQRSAFAVSAAERIVRGLESDPPGSLAPSREALGRWRRMIEAVWSGLGGDPNAAPVLAAAIGHVYLTPGFAEGSHDRPADAMDHVVMASLYAAECYLHGCLEFACWVGWRGFDLATVHAAADVDWPHRRPPGIGSYGWELAHPAVQAELDRQLADIEQIDELGGVLSQPDGEKRVLLARLRNSGQDLG